LPSERFRLYAVVARFPHNLAGQVPWQEQQAGVYDCRWGLDVVRVLVAGQLPREPRNAPLHLFSAAPELIGFGRGAYRRRSETTSLLLGQLLEQFQGEGFGMVYTMEDFKRDFFKEHFAKLPAEERRQVLQDLPPEEILAALSAEQIRAYLDRLTARQPPRPGKSRRKK
jgi:hypothetical protein